MTWVANKIILKTFTSKSRPDGLYEKYIRLWNENGLKGSLRKIEKIYFCLVDEGLSSNLVDSNLENLLDANLGNENPNRLIIPRQGTVSPWSSKATEISRICGLNEVLRIEYGISYFFNGTPSNVMDEFANMTCDLMLEQVERRIPSLNYFSDQSPRPLRRIKIAHDFRKNLIKANERMQLSLSEEEIVYLVNHFEEIGRDPSDVELMMFAQINSEHCRHKIFNSEFIIDGVWQTRTPFDLIRSTYSANPDNVLKAYSDNAAILKGQEAKFLFSSFSDRRYQFKEELRHLVVKAETHNHPTAIAPHPGAGTGAGGEIRDEGATGRGGMPKAGIVGFSLNYLRIKNLPMSWELDLPLPDKVASALQIICQAPVGAANYNNEFGRPGLVGYFRSFEAIEITEDNLLHRGYAKPIMLAGGIGSIRYDQIEKKYIPNNTPILVIGGPSFLIGLGGGASSSSKEGTMGSLSDRASVQRANPEMQRRCQEVISFCSLMADKNPIISIHDVGAGGLSNALPELARDGGCGAKIFLSKIPSGDLSLSPLEVFCNEAQERYVIAIDRNSLDEFFYICRRERCPVALIGESISDKKVQLIDEDKNILVDLSFDMLFEDLPKPKIDAKTVKIITPPACFSQFVLSDLIHPVLLHPTVASKEYLITIADRTVSGIVSRDQMVGPWQIPVSDCAVVASSIGSSSGEVIAVGERSPVALLDSAASARMALAETITNMAGVLIEKLEKISISANWMCSCGTKGDDQKLFEAVRGISEKFCSDLGICIPVGKDSMSMRTNWLDNGKRLSIVAPLSLICSGFASVIDIEKCLTPELNLDFESKLLLLDFGYDRLGGSIACEVTGQSGKDAPDIEPKDLQSLFSFMQEANNNNLLHAYHDRSDGGLFVCLSEMLITSRCGADIKMPLNRDPIAFWFNEEIGALVQVAKNDCSAVVALLKKYDIFEKCHWLGCPNEGDILKIWSSTNILFSKSWLQLQDIWTETHNAITKLRDAPECVDQLIDSRRSIGPGLANCFIPKNKNFPINRNNLNKTTCRPKVAILREQGINGQTEMAYAFKHCGFEAIDVHMTDLIDKRDDLSSYRVLAVCGGFSFGDVLGAGVGWANSILFNERLRAIFKTFLNRVDTITLGICNGCQMISHISSLVPGGGNFIALKENKSRQFESRLVSVEVKPSKSVFFEGLSGLRFPIAVAHGEGRFPHSASTIRKLEEHGEVVMNYVDQFGVTSDTYPSNPNGSINGLSGICSSDGRVTILMPHPERVVLRQQLSYVPKGTPLITPWMTVFDNAYQFVNNQQ